MRQILSTGTFCCQDSHWLSRSFQTVIINIELSAELFYGLTNYISIEEVRKNDCWNDCQRALWTVVIWFQENPRVQSRKDLYILIQVVLNSTVLDGLEIYFSCLQKLTSASDLDFQPVSIPWITFHIFLWKLKFSMLKVCFKNIFSNLGFRKCIGFLVPVMKLNSTFHIFWIIMNYFSSVYRLV